jgi:hypothetical protein
MITIRIRTEEQHHDHLLMDSGCNKTTLPRSLAVDRGLSQEIGPTSVMTWANGQTEVISSTTSLGPLTPLLSDQVTTPLLAANDLLKVNNRVVSDSDGSYVENKSSGQRTVLLENNGLWYMSIDDLKALDPDSSDAPAISMHHQAHAGVTSSRATRDLVWDLHRRFGHCSCESMCRAVEEGENPTWLHAGVSAD